MNRDLGTLADREFDLLIIGGGIFGACAARDAAMRGLSVALVERGDFGHATSANSFKMVHGGIRYLQHADVYRMRQSSNERNAFLRLAPHLVRPLPIVIPSYGYGMKSKPALRAGMLLYDLIACDRNRGISDPSRRVPRGRCISRTNALELFPGLNPDGLTGAAVFHDGQMYNPPRLVLSFLRSAVEMGAVAANYVEVTRLLKNDNRITGAAARDSLTGDQLQIRAKMVLNAAGPYAEQVLQRGIGLRLSPQGVYSRDACFLVPRRLTGDYGLAVLGRTSDPDAVFGRGARHLFIIPWRGYTLVGVWHVIHQDDPDEITVRTAELQAFIDEVNDAYPGLGLTLADVGLWHAGLVPFGENAPGATNLRYGKRSRLVDHEKEHRLDGLVTLIGVRYTTAQCEASQAVNLICRKLNRRLPKSGVRRIPVYGGDIDDFESFVRQAVDARPPGLSAETVTAMAHNHGTAYRDLLVSIDSQPTLAETLGSSAVIKAEVVHAVRREMAHKLGDVVFRRTNLGTGGDPGEAALTECAGLMAGELGWNGPRTAEEIADVRAGLPNL